MRIKIYLLLSYKGGWVKTPALPNARDSGLTFFFEKAVFGFRLFLIQFGES